MTPPIASGIISISRLLGFMRSLSLRRSLTGSAQMVEEGQTSQSLSKFGPNEILSDSGEHNLQFSHFFAHSFRHSGAGRDPSSFFHHWGPQL